MLEGPVDLGERKKIDFSLSERLAANALKRSVGDQRRKYFVKKLERVVKAQRGEALWTFERISNDSMIISQTHF